MRRFRNGFSFGANYTLGLSFTGNTGLVKRLQHAADGSFSLRADQAEYEELNKNLDMRPHFFKANAIWATPRAPEALGTIVGAILNDWQIAGVLTAGSGQAYDLTYNYQNNGGNVNLTGSPDYGARIRLHRRPGQRMLGRSVRAVQHRGGDRSHLRQPRSGVGTQHHAGVPEQDRRPVVVA